MDSGVSVDRDDYSSSSDEMEATPRAPLAHLKSCRDPDFCSYLKRKAEKRDKEVRFWFTYIRAYVPLMKLMLEEYKMKWESCQFRKYAKDNNPDPEDMDDDSDTSNGTVTSCIDMGFPNGEPKPSPEISSGRGNIKNGLYMFISYVRGGWVYSEVKQYFRKELGVRCFRTPVINYALKGPNDFRAMMKFKNEKARVDVFIELCHSDMLQHFIFVCVDADESYFQDSVIANLRNTKGFLGLPRFCVTLRN